MISYILSGVFALVLTYLFDRFVISPLWEKWKVRKHDAKHK